MKAVIAAVLFSLLSVNNYCLAAADVRRVQPFSELDLCIPFNVRLEHPANGDGYRVLISGDSTVVKAVRTIYQETSTYFPAVPFDIPGVLYITAANASFQSNSPINITVQMPPKKLQAIDVTKGTEVSFANGFQISESPGVWNVPGGALLLAPNMSINGPLSMSAQDSADDPVFQRGGRIVWTNARAQQEALQAISLEGPVTAVINSSTAAPGLQSFSLQPNVDAPPDLTTSFANVTLALEPSELSYMAQASLRNTFYPNRTCFRDSCYTRVVTGSYPAGQLQAPAENVAFSESDYIPYDVVGTPVAWTTCVQGITSFQCLSDATNQTCAASSS